MRFRRRRAAGRDILHRWEGNPVISIEDIPFSCLDVMNAGVVKKDGEYILVVRVEDMQGKSIFVTARSQDGFYFEVSEKPLMRPAEEEPYRHFESRGVEDPRITFLDDTYYIVYTANSAFGTRIGLAKTSDFETVERVGLISEPDNKNGALFPEKFDGRYARLERPRDGGSIWLSFSHDLIYWGESVPLLRPRGVGYWDSDRVGCAAPPVLIDDGWLLVYYGVRNTSAGPIFRLGAAVLDREQPQRVLYRSDVPILSPREMYERVGDVNNVVFSCGALVEDGMLAIYYGAANTAICLGTSTLQRVKEFCSPGGGAL